MSSQPSMKWTGDISQIERMYNEMSAMNQKLKSQLQDVHESNHKHHEHSHSLIKEGTHLLQNMVVQYLSIEAGIEAVKASMEDYVQLLEKGAEKSKEIAENIVKTSVATNTLANKDKYKAAAVAFESSGKGTQKEYADTLAGVLGANPMGSEQQNAALTSRAAEASPILNQPGFRNLVGEMGKLFNPKEGEENKIVDYAANAYMHGGKHSEELGDRMTMNAVQKMVETGMVKDPRDAFSYAESAIIQNQPPRGLGSIADKLAGEIPLEHAMGHPLSPDQKAKNQLAKMNGPNRAADRFQYILNNPDAARAMGLDVEVGRMKKDFDAIRGGFHEGVLDDELHKLHEGPLGALHKIERDADIAEAQATTQYETEGSVRESLYKQVEAKINKTGGSHLIPDYLEKKFHKFEIFSDPMLGKTQDVLDFYSQTDTNGRYGNLQAAGFSLEEAKALIADLQKTLNENTAAIKAAANAKPTTRTSTNVHMEGGGH